MERDKEEETGRGMQGSRQGEGRGGDGKGRKESIRHFCAIIPGALLY